MASAEDQRIVVFDDDPTGIQTVHDCLLVTRWDQDTLRKGFEDERPVFYVLTNTRAYPPKEATRIVREATANVLALAQESGQKPLLVSRSDSTLRSHFPLEVDLLTAAAQSSWAAPVDAVFVVPAFIEGGRVTRDDIHYVITDGNRVPASETEFARDSVFGYSTSHLPSYIEEKTRRTTLASQVASVSLDLLDDEAALASFLNELSRRRYVVVNAESYDHLNRFATAVLAAAAQGKRFAFQSAASLVRALAGLDEQPLLDRAIVRHKGPGLFIVGSHVHKTTMQLNRLLDAPDTKGIPVDVKRILENSEAMQGETTDNMVTAMAQDRTPVVYTSRREQAFPSRQRRLEAGRKVSAFLVSIVRALEATPSYLVAKGGITSHDVLVDGLDVSSTRVLGQILPGVPVVRMPVGNRFANMPYVIFPGNVGDQNALLDVFNTLSAAEAAKEH